MANHSSSLLINYIIIFAYSLVFFISCSSSVESQPKLCNFDDLNKKRNNFIDDIDSCNVGLLRSCKIVKIFQLGDSISDVGNLIREGPERVAAPYGRLPYGTNFPMGPTGRASNGNLMIDYFALDAGLPLIPPFKKNDSDFSHGVNFAVAGSTALPADVLETLNISSLLTNTSLKVQMDWLTTHLKSIPFKMEMDVLILGPFGGSDYEYAISQGKSVEEIKTTLIPKVVDEIIRQIRGLHRLGIRIVFVPGLHTISGLPYYRTAFPEENDEVAVRHNSQLQEAIDKLNREEDTYTLKAYLDYFSAYQALQSYATSGGEHRMDEKVCCGSGGGDYNFNSTRRCGAEGVVACSDPEKHISWDGINLTQEAYRIMSKDILYRISSKLGCPL